MPHSTLAERRLVTIPYSEAAMFAGIAGQQLMAREEDCYINGDIIPKEKRLGCYVYTRRGRIALLKSEAGWKDEEEPKDAA